MTENTPIQSAPDVGVKEETESTSNITQALEDTHLKTEEEDGHKVFVGNLSFQTTEEELEKFFTVAGKVLKTNIITRGTRSLGYGFVTFESETEAEEAVNKLDKKELDGREINVEVAKPKEETDRTQVSTQRGRGRGGRSRGHGNKTNRRRFSNEECDEVDNKNHVEAQPEDYNEEIGHSEAIDNTSHEYHRGRGRGRGERGFRGRRFSRGRGGHAPPSHLGEPSKTTVFVSNLPYSFGNDELKTLFQGYNIVSSHVACMKSGRSKGFGFVEFADESEQQRAISNNGNLHAEDREILVKVSRSEIHSEIPNEDDHNNESVAPTSNE
ncbi:hypothetical protein K7432_003355 [Basidiobolus ranarum]|uniref:RRM domain-containing protein n=1 Tax=Basidiobolus ranarum TaxID=34480 RepID=A0ABR2X004_9FUNG